MGRDEDVGHLRRSAWERDPQSLANDPAVLGGSLEKVMVSGLESVMAMDSHASGKLSFND